MYISKQCPLCNRTMALQLTDEEYTKYFDLVGTVFIQDIFPNMDKVEREFLISGYCVECQNLIFGSDYEMNNKWSDLNLYP